MIFLYIFLGLLLIYLIIGLYFLNFSINPKFSKKRLFKHKKNDEIPLSNGESKEWFKKIIYNDVYIKSFDNLKLHAYEIKNKSSIWVIICHGYTNSGLEMLNATKHYYDQGYNILLIDQRAHGLSEGKFSTMGWLERLDVINWCQYLNNNYSNIDIILYGVSMGATTVMMSIGEDLPKNVLCAIEDCGFTSIYKEFFNQLRYLHFLPRNIIFAANIYTRIFIHFNIYDGDAIKQIKKSKVPIMFIHGSKDKFVPLSNLELAYESCPQYKYKLIIEGAKHMKSSVTDPITYWNSVDEFIKKNL